MRLCDRFIKGGLLWLLFFTPLAFGTVHAWAYSLVEGIVALMVLAWALRIWSLRTASTTLTNSHAWPYALPLVLFIAYGVFQLLPLPPNVLNAISPATYEVYRRALPGWPGRVPFADVLAEAKSEGERGRGGEGENRGEGELLPVSGLRSPVGPASWRSLSISPILTQSDLLKFATYTLLFLLVLFYPAPGAFRDPHHRVEYEIAFMRPLLYTILISGFLVATLGFLNLFTWNGKVLWFFVPHDAGGGGGGTRAAAPFIAPPSFANYLVMTLPLMVMGTFWRTFLTPHRLGGGFRVLCAFAGFIAFCGILLSLSRAGWASAVLGVAMLALLAMLGRGGKSWIARTPFRRLVTFSIATFCLFLTVALFFVGPRGQENLDLRLQETATEAASLHGRFAVWRDSLDMVRDFPVTGVGLGAWPDLFPRYQDPRLTGFYREAHNDYLELVAETGIVGAFLLAWFFLLCLTRILKRAFALDPNVLPVVAALFAGMCGMAFHEVFDFNLQIPANAILFTVMLAMSVRLCGTGFRGQGSIRGQGSGVRGQEERTGDRRPETGERGLGTGFWSSPSRPPSPVSRRRKAAVGALILGGAASLLLALAFSQPMGTYPYYLRKQASLTDALNAVYDYPANAEAQTVLFDKARAVNSTGWQLNELERILWLAPGKAAVRDAYVTRLLLQGRREEALYQITLSVADLPSVNQHFYLSPEVAPMLDPREHRAVVAGFTKAIEDGRPGALEGLAEFYRRTGRFSKRESLYEEALAAARTPGEKQEYLLKTADASIGARDFVKAENLLLDAARLKPDDTALLTKLITQVYVPQKNFAAAERAVAEGIRNGADALTLQTALAEAARSSGEVGIAAKALKTALANGSNGARRPRDRYRAYIRLARVARSLEKDEVEEQALEKAIELQPNAYAALIEVGSMHEARGDYKRAALYYRKATIANRTSADALARLARVEERRFRFPEADKAYAAAVRLAPQNEGLRRQYEAFKKRVEKGREEGPG